MSNRYGHITVTDYKVVPVNPFRARTAKLLREIEWSGGCCGGKKCPVEECTDGGGGCGQKSHAPDCALAALLREAEAP